MGIVNEEIWKCKNCGFEFVAENGLYEADPCDFGTTHCVSAYFCPNCGNVKNLSNCISLDRPEAGNEDLIRYDSDICECCGTKMKRLEKPRFKLFGRNYLCPECKKKTLKFLKDGDEWMT